MEHKPERVVVGPAWAANIIQQIALEALEADLVDEWRIPSAPGVFVRMLQYSRTVWVWVAYKGKGVVGAGEFYVFSSYIEEGHQAISPPYQRKGIYSSVMSWLDKRFPGRQIVPDDMHSPAMASFWEKKRKNPPLDKQTKINLEGMLWELRNNYLDVVLVPSRRGEGMLRQAQSQNAPWYRDFCAGHSARPRRRLRRKHHDTKVKRRDTERVLLNLIAGRDIHGWYANELLNIAQTYHKDYADPSEQDPSEQDPSEQDPSEQDPSEQDLEEAPF